MQAYYSDPALKKRVFSLSLGLLTMDLVLLSASPTGPGDTDSAPLCAVAHPTHDLYTHVDIGTSSECLTLADGPQRARARASMLTQTTLHTHVQLLHSVCPAGTHSKQHSGQRQPN